MNYVEDFRRVLLHLKELHPSSPFYAVGHSFGANTLLRYLGICGSNNIPSRLEGAVSVSNPFDF
jgi:predicted alpha/beta-fold hydrolase